ncbi:polysaccharide deacetylase family protein [Bacillus sp. FSL K6-3431]|uniref:polysaccharide deacetylase family protein n=1 Tax=Bacillus sp. FSL K6-3431 TaxID=2921500 RepID=UPI0030FD1D3F
MTKIKITLMLLIVVLAACSLQKSPPVKELNSRRIDIQPKEMQPSLQRTFLTEMIDKAEKGMVSGSQFSALDSTISEVKAQWGRPGSVSLAGSGYYAVFNKKQVTFGYNKYGEIFDVRSYVKDQEITVNEIESSFGKPDLERGNNEERIFVYNINPQIELKVVISNEKNSVDHISIFNPNRVISEMNYTLPINGNSNKLTKQSWNSMLDWRKQIVEFSKTQENVFIHGTNQKMVALTFDDGPDNTVTPAIIDILEKYDVNGNFFFIGSNVKLYPEVVKSAYEKGNLVLNHSNNHVELTKLSIEGIQMEIDGAEEAIQSIIGKRPAIIRTPYGDTNEQVAAVSKEKGYSIVLWSIDTLDWSQKEVSNITKNIVDNVRNGDIILMHSATEHSETAKALPLIIETLQKNNYQIVDLETLLDIPAYQ